MKVFNTLSRKKEEFIPTKGRKVGIYACGPTVYNYIHIGNARPICVFDVLRRYLKYRGYEVNFVQNFTDIDDKIINKANEDNKNYKDISEKFIEEYKKDAKGLNVMEADTHPKATENIEEIIKTISELVEKGYAYASASGDVYFRTKKFDEYGKLSAQPIDDLEIGSRINVGEEKEDPLDFALWKSAKPGEPSWVSPWGKGRPGWHIECSAMARRYIGDTVDIHCGGQDLIFPHHENEIAQSECSTGKPFAKYWMHNGYINVDNKKMSKSLNNFFTVREVSEHFGYEPIRYLMIASHYRSPINYSADILEQCKSALSRLYNCKENLKFKIENSDVKSNEKDNEIKESLNHRRNLFINALDDDLNTADAISVIFDLVRDINTLIISDENASKNISSYALSLFNELADVLGILCEEKEDNLDEDVEKLISERNLARKNKDFALADKIRDNLKNQGIVIEDTPQGIKWKKI